MNCLPGPVTDTRLPVNKIREIAGGENLMSEIIITERTIAKPTKTKVFDWREHAISHKALMGKPFKQIDFLVNDLMCTPGLGIIAAIKKIGKSYMVLQLSGNVSSGTPFLGHTVRQGTVVYMALEDGENRVHARLKEQGLEDENLPIIYIYQFPPLNTKEGIIALKQVISEYKPILIIIDTLAKACRNVSLKENEAGAIVDIFNQLHDLAIESKLVILIVAHHGKGSSTHDAGFDIRGSSGIPGATDFNIGLYRNTDGTYELVAEGRDIPGEDLRLNFDKEITHTWSNAGDEQDLRRKEAEQKIIDAIITLGQKVDAANIAEQAGVDRSTAQYHLKRMRKDGTVTYEISNNKKILYSTSSTSSTD